MLLHVNDSNNCDAAKYKYITKNNIFVYECSKMECRCIMMFSFFVCTFMR